MHHRLDATEWERVCVFVCVRSIVSRSHLSRARINILHNSTLEITTDSIVLRFTFVKMCQIKYFLIACSVCLLLFAKNDAYLVNAHTYTPPKWCWNVSPRQKSHSRFIEWNKVVTFINMPSSGVGRKRWYLYRNLLRRLFMATQKWYSRRLSCGNKTFLFCLCLSPFLSLLFHIAQSLWYFYVCSVLNLRNNISSTHCKHM